MFLFKGLSCVTFRLALLYKIYALAFRFYQNIKYFLKVHKQNV